MTRQEMINIVHKFVKAFNDYDAEAAMKLFAEDCEITDPHGRVIAGKAILAEGTKAFLNKSAYPYTQFYESLREDVDVEKNTLWSTWKMTRTQGDKVTYQYGCDTFQFENGLIRRQAVYGQANMFAE